MTSFTICTEEEELAEKNGSACRTTGECKLLEDVKEVVRGPPRRRGFTWQVMTTDFGLGKHRSGRLSMRVWKGAESVISSKGHSFSTPEVVMSDFSQGEPRHETSGKTRSSHSDRSVKVFTQEESELEGNEGIVLSLHRA